jgi:hypothetical protein
MGKCGRRDQSAATRVAERPPLHLVRDNRFTGGRVGLGKLRGLRSRIQHPRALKRCGCSDRADSSRRRLPSGYQRLLCSGCGQHRRPPLGLDQGSDRIPACRVLRFRLHRRFPRVSGSLPSETRWKLPDEPGIGRSSAASLGLHRDREGRVELGGPFPIDRVWLGCGGSAALDPRQTHLLAALDRASGRLERSDRRVEPRQIRFTFEALISPAKGLYLGTQGEAALVRFLEVGPWGP